MGKAEDHRDARPGLAMSPQAEASKMLEAALQQMDGIISGRISYLYANFFKGQFK
jgi:hypothetical protein